MSDQTRPWVTLDSAKSPVQAAVGVFKELKGDKSGLPVTSLSIGAETDAIDLTVTFRISSDYRSELGGGPEIRQTTEDWVWRMLGLRSKAILAQTNSRDLLNHGLHIGAWDYIEKKIDPGFVLPETVWPMVEESARDEHMRDIPHRIIRGQRLESIIAAFKESERRNPAIMPAVIYLDPQQNPTGLHLDIKEMRAVLNWVNEKNIEREQAGLPPITVLIDLPYYSACLQQNLPPYLICGVQGLDLDKDYPHVPKIACISLSKSFGTATPGMSILAYSKHFESFIMTRMPRNNGFSYIPEFFQAVAGKMHHNNDGEILARFARHRKKYSEGREMAAEILGSYLPIVDGDPSMTGLFVIPPHMLGRAVTCHDGNVRITTNAHHFVEIVDNEARTVIVDNSIAGHDYTRIAFREEPKNIKGPLTAIAKVCESIQNSPEV